MTEIIDLAFVQDSEGVFDLAIASNGDFETVDGFDTAISMSILCERRANAEQVPTPRLRRGWIGNADGDIEDFEIGSLVWTYYQARLTSDTANGLKSSADAGLEWFVEDDLVQRITSSVTFTDVQITLSVDFVTETGPVETRNFVLWENTGN